MNTDLGRRQVIVDGKVLVGAVVYTREPKLKCQVYSSVVRIEVQVPHRVRNRIRVELAVHIDGGLRGGHHHVVQLVVVRVAVPGTEPQRLSKI